MVDHRFSRVGPVVLAVAVVGLLPVSGTAESSARPACNAGKRLMATEVFDPYNILGNGPVGAPTDPGTLTCPGAEPTGNPMQPCPPGSPTSLRGVSGTSRMVSPSALLSGSLHWEINADFDAQGAGPAWGTFRLELDNGGVWEGSYSDERTKVEDINAWIGRARFVGRGTSGRVRGMFLKFDEVAFTFTPLPLAWLGAADAEILARRPR